MEFKLNHLFFMDDLKLFEKSNDQIDSLVETVFAISVCICMYLSRHHKKMFKIHIKGMVRIRYYIIE